MSANFNAISSFLATCAVAGRGLIVKKNTRQPEKMLILYDIEN